MNLPAQPPLGEELDEPTPVPKNDKIPTKVVQTSYQKLGEKVNRGKARVVMIRKKKKRKLNKYGVEFLWAVPSASTAV